MEPALALGRELAAASLGAGQPFLGTEQRGLAARAPVLQLTMRSHASGGRESRFTL